MFWIGLGTGIVAGVALAVILVNAIGGPRW